MVKLLVENDADINAKNIFDKTPLHSCAVHGEIILQISNQKFVWSCKAVNPSGF